ncbi:MAG: Ig-like domain-containing protein [Leptospiraceae bacterium]|nr:Ig-like domain-containing protein [Leptospiraceae bacterium]
MVITTGITDIAGISLLSDSSYNFTTTNQFQLTSITQVNGSIWVDRNQVITLNFNKNINSSTINSSTFSITQSGNPVSGSYSVNGNSASFTPSSSYGFNTVYTINITSGILDTFGYSVSNLQSSSFTSIYGYRIFVTSNSYQGNHGGGADLCNNDPGKPNSSIYSPVFSLTPNLKVNTPYVRSDGTSIMLTDSSGSPSSSLNNSISTSNEKVWYGTNMYTKYCFIYPSDCCPADANSSLKTYNCPYQCNRNS